jgi:hypothetical protein
VTCADSRLAGHRYHFGVDHNSPPPTRRRLASSVDAKSEGRSGCLISGAVLGIIVGATFAFYGLPPILRHYYGEKHIAAGAQYVGDAKTVSVARVDITPDPASGPPGEMQGMWFVTVVVTTNKTWSPVPADFEMELTGLSDWVEATAMAVDKSGPGGGIALGDEVRIFLTFPMSASKPEANPRYLHISDPRVRLTLP